jgi:hypothetical protein
MIIESCFSRHTSYVITTFFKKTWMSSVRDESTTATGTRETQDNAAKIQYTTCRYTSLKLPATGQYPQQKTEKSKRTKCSNQHARLPTPNKNISHMSIVKYKRHGDAEYMYVYTSRQKVSSNKQLLVVCRIGKRMDSQHSIRPFFKKEAKPTHSALVSHTGVQRVREPLVVLTGGFLVPRTRAQRPDELAALCENHAQFLAQALDAELGLAHADALQSVGR